MHVCWCWWMCWDVCVNVNVCVCVKNCIESTTPPSWDVEIAKYAAPAYVSYNVSIRATAAHQLISIPFPSSDAFWVPIWQVLWVRPHVYNENHNWLPVFCRVYNSKSHNHHLPVLEFFIVIFIWIVDVFAHVLICCLFPGCTGMWWILICVSSVGVDVGVLFGTFVCVPPFFAILLIDGYTHCANILTIVYQLIT